MNDTQLYLGDCLDILPSIGHVQAVITDPPYGTGKLGTNGSSYTKNVQRTSFDWDVWSTDWLSLVDATCMAVFVPYTKLPEMLVGNRLLCGVTRQGVCVQNVSPMYRMHTIVLIGKTPINYAMDWCQYSNSSKNLKKYHPVEKPLELIKWLVEMCTNPGDTVLDPFMGSGTTGIACAQLRRKFIGIEINQDYYSIAKQRIEAASFTIPLSAL